MKQLKLIVVVFAVMLTASCGDNATKNSQTEQAKADSLALLNSHSAQNSLDYFGVYEGVVPAASAEGMHIVLTLNADTTYKVVTNYDGKIPGVYERVGKYTIIGGSIVSIKPSENQQFYFKIEEGQVVFLDQQMQKITGDFAAMYVMRKK